nr:hypothetical protein [Salmonella enterica subsp. diarizonae]
MSNGKTKMRAGSFLTVMLIPLASPFCLLVDGGLIGIDVMPVASKYRDYSITCPKAESVVKFMLFLLNVENSHFMNAFHVIVEKEETTINIIM